jgi:hypothetical protein
MTGQRSKDWMHAIGVVGCWVGLVACSSGEASRVDESGQSPVPTEAPPPPPPPPPPNETFEEMKARLEAEKPRFMARQLALLEARYDLSDRPGRVRMTRGKPVQVGSGSSCRTGSRGRGCRR